MLQAESLASSLEISKVLSLLVLELEVLEALQVQIHPHQLLLLKPQMQLT
jgi:hypothetical protein